MCEFFRPWGPSEGVKGHRHRLPFYLPHVHHTDPPPLLEFHHFSSVAESGHVQAIGAAMSDSLTVNYRLVVRDIGSVSLLHSPQISVKRRCSPRDL